MTEPRLTVADLSVHFRLDGGWLRPVRTLKAVDGVSLRLDPGETLGVVGESGCGKSTLARAIAGLVPATAGRVRLDGRPWVASDGEDVAAPPAGPRPVQMVFQDPLASLNPRMTVGDSVAEPLRGRRLSRAERARRVHAALQRVGLTPEHAARYPHEFSGGQCQRVGIARALIIEPRVLICDEAVSALDVSVQAQIVNLLRDLQADTGVAQLFIAHDLSVVRKISHRVLVMYLGRAVEVADRDTLYQRPRHPYTQALLAAVPKPDPRAARPRPVASEEVPSPLAPPPGCAFHPRCPWATAVCRTDVPPLRSVDGRAVACHHAERTLGRPPVGAPAA